MSKAFDCVADVYIDNDIVETQRFKVMADNSGNAIDKVNRRFWGKDMLITSMELRRTEQILKDRNGQIFPIIF